MRIRDWSSDVCSSDLAQVSRASVNVGAHIPRIVAEAIARGEPRPGAGHDLHEAHGAGAGDRRRIAVALGAHHRPDPRLGNAETLCGFDNMGGIGMRSRDSSRRGGERSRGRKEGEEYRSEERRVGKGGGSTFRSRLSPYSVKKKKKKKKI